MTDFTRNDFTPTGMIHYLFNELHKALSTEARANMDTTLRQMATRVDSLHHDFAIHVSDTTPLKD